MRLTLIVTQWADPRYHWDKKATVLWCMKDEVRKKDAARNTLLRVVAGIIAQNHHRRTKTSPILYPPNSVALQLQIVQDSLGCSMSFEFVAAATLH